MNHSEQLLQQLVSLRRQLGKQPAVQKIKLLTALQPAALKSRKSLQLFADTLLFIIAYPDNKTVYNLARQSLQELHAVIRSDEQKKTRLYNSGITGTAVCAAFGFEIVHWLRNEYPAAIRIASFEAADGQLTSILSAMMSKLESEILQDSYFDWKEWLLRTAAPGQDLLDGLLAVFDNNNSRPEVKDELWSALGVNTEIQFTEHSVLPESMVQPFYHQTLMRKPTATTVVHPKKIKLSEADAAAIIACSRMILVRHLREIDPISFADTKLVSYYQLPRGLSMALMEMTPERRHPIDSYIGYTVFKNGLPVAYAGSWLLFDSGRIGLNVFPAYRGGESQTIFQQVLQLHAQVYRLKRFTVDPYQIGNKNSDGIHSGAFWVYYHAGFRPVLPQLLELARAEANKIKATPGYRSPAPVLKQLAENKLEKLLQKKAVRFDANDLSLAYANVLQKKYKNDRTGFEKGSTKKLAELLQVKNTNDPTMQFLLYNWALLLLPTLKEWQYDTGLKKTLKKLLLLKADGSEAAYHTALQKATGLRQLIEKMVQL